MKNVLAFCALLGLALQSAAQPSEPVKLAILAESADAANATFLLTAALSPNPKLHLLERDQINKVYQEQALSTQNLNLLKLGQILGADGLLIMDVSKIKATSTKPPHYYFDLTARLIAIKPGLVLSAEQITVPSDGWREWSDSYAEHLQSFLPKLLLPAKDAIPISVVNLRCATQSGAAPEMERQLKLLTIQRLSREPRFFVLERERMQSLAEEKALNLDESAFWNGSYLLEAVVDQNGYNKDTITLSARLPPPKGAAPLLIEISDSRTNFTGLINQLAAKVNESLKISAASPAWDAAGEAAKYCDEAQWALRWDIYPEAQAAVESAWALGKRDMDCARTRVAAYMLEASKKITDPGTLGSTFGPTYNSYGKILYPRLSDAEIQSFIKNTLKDYLSGRYTIMDQGDTKIVRFILGESPPDPKNIDLALRALEIYREFFAQVPEAGLQRAWTNKYSQSLDG